VRAGQAPTPRAALDKVDSLITSGLSNTPKPEYLQTGIGSTMPVAVEVLRSPTGLG
jgi:hypothetical protein